MEPHQVEAAKTCLKGSESGTLAFPQIVQTLSDSGIESYAVDFRRRIVTYFRDDGKSIELPLHQFQSSVAANFDQSAIQAAVKQAQQNIAGYTFKGFCEKAAAAGCAQYVVSMLGRRVVYLGRTAETHVELMP